MNLPDVLEPELSLVICGTAAGALSAALGQYYANPGNKFWRTLHETRLTNRLLSPAEFHQLPRYGIGLTDLEKTQSGNDSDLVFGGDSPRVLHEKILHFNPAVLCFNSKRAAKEFLGAPRVGFGFQKERVGRTALFVAPSTSGLAVRSWDASVWHVMAAHVRRHRAQLPRRHIP